MTPERYHRITSVLDKRQPDLTVITDEVHKGRNVAAIIRNCDAVGIDTIHAVVPEAGFQHYRGTTQGSHRWVEVVSHQSVEEPIRSLQYQGFQVLAAHLSSVSVDYRQVDYTRPTALLLGTEKYGVSEAALAQIDQPITIPMEGMVASFNVSVACAIILLEARHQRERSGYYQQRRLADDIYRQRLFCWCYPDLADYCHQHQLDYPKLNQKGDIVDGPDWYRAVKKKVVERGQ